MDNDTSIAAVLREKRCARLPRRTIGVILSRTVKFFTVLFLLSINQASAEGHAHIQSMAPHAAQSDIGPINWPVDSSLRSDAHTIYFPYFLPEDTSHTTQPHHDDGDAPRSTDIVIAFLTFGLLVAAVLQWNALKLQVSKLGEAIDEDRKTAAAHAIETNKALQIADRNATAAQKAADVAESSLRDIERPYVFFLPLDYTLGDIGDVQHDAIAILGGRHEPSIRFNLKNYGKTPALLTRIECEIFYANEPPNESLRRSITLPQNSILAAGDSSEALEFIAEKLNEETAAGVRSGTIHFFFRGEITYNDVFGVVHRTFFTWYTDTLGGELQRYGDATANRHT